MNPSEQGLGALFFEPLEFELLERILGDPSPACGIRIASENLWEPSVAFEGGQSSYNFSLLSPPSLCYKIYIKKLNKT